MEGQKKNSVDERSDKDIVYSKAIKAGKRIYYLDVKKSKKGELFLAITESKKIFQGEGENAQYTFEKHKIFLYKEDFEKFSDGLKDVLSFIYQRQTPETPTTTESVENVEENEPMISDEIKIDIDF